MSCRLHCSKSACCGARFKRRTHAAQVGSNVLRHRAFVARGPQSRAVRPAAASAPVERLESRKPKITKAVACRRPCASAQRRESKAVQAQAVARAGGGGALGYGSTGLVVREAQHPPPNRSFHVTAQSCALVCT